LLLQCIEKVCRFYRPRIPAGVLVLLGITVLNYFSYYTFHQNYFSDICSRDNFPSAAVTVRRLHDTNRSGWWALPMITIIGIVIPFYFALQDGQAGANQYGTNSKPGSSARTF
jgi:uncharacterized membrane protein YhaH (DUF805 family)